MNTGICKSPDSRNWRELYKAALAEFGESKLLERIAEAEKAVGLRARELFQAADDNPPHSGTSKPKPPPIFLTDHWSYAPLP